MSDIREASVSVAAVRIQYAGAVLVGDHASGVSELLVDDAFEFNEGTGELLIGGDTLAYTGWDDETNTIILAAPTTSAYDDDDQVRLLPSTPIKVADVVDIDGASMPALVWHTLDPLLREGIRDPNEQETGTIFYTGDYEKVWLVNCPGKVPSIDPAATGLDGGDDDAGTDPYPDFPTAEFDLTSPDAFMVYIDGATPYDFLASQPAPGAYGTITYFTGTASDYAVHNDVTGGVPGIAWPIWYIPPTGPMSAGLDVGIQIEGESLVPEFFGSSEVLFGARSGSPTDFGPDSDAVRYPVWNWQEQSPPAFSDIGSGIPWDGAGWYPDFSIHTVSNPGAVFVLMDAIEGTPDTTHFRHIRIGIQDKV